MFNDQRVKNKLTDSNYLLDLKQPDFVCISETGLNANSVTVIMHLMVGKRSYSVYRKRRKDIILFNSFITLVIN